MKICPKCNTHVPDDALHCSGCGVKFAAPSQPAQPVYYVDPSDHTAEFDRKDIEDNKVFAIAAYLLGAAGIIIALLASSDSRYADFHVRQSLKIRIVEVLTVLIGAALCWTFVAMIAAGIFVVILEIVNIIAIVNVCKGKAKEPAIIKNFTFLK